VYKELCKLAIICAETAPSLEKTASSM